MTEQFQVLERGEDPVEVALREPCVLEWLGSLTPGTRPSYICDFRGWLRWLWRQPNWQGWSPSRLLQAQEDAKRGDRMILPRLMQEWVQMKGGTYGSMIVRLARVRSFFEYDDEIELPSTRKWNPQPTKDPVQGNLTFEQVRQIITHAGIRDQAIFLTLLQGLMDQERFHQFNMKYAKQLVDHLRTQGVDVPFKIWFTRGRKRNRKKYHTFLYHDALEAWRKYFELVRGSWPKDGEAIALHEKGRPMPLAKSGIRPVFNTLARQLRIKPPPKTGGDSGNRTGVAPHEAFRDVVTSRLQTAKEKGFDMTLTDYWMGHTVDPYQYNKFTTLEPDYVLKNAKIAAQYLDVLTHPTLQNAEKLQSLGKENEELRGDIATMRQDLARLQGLWESVLQKKITNTT